jgi:ribosomal protein L20
MVFLTSLLRKLPTPEWLLKETIPGKRTDNKWWRLETFRFTFSSDGRRQRCFKIAYPYMRNRWRLASRNRQFKPIFQAELQDTRIDAAAREHGLRQHTLTASLKRQNIQLSPAILADLAIYEPRTFECLSLIAKQHIINTNLQVPDPEHEYDEQDTEPDIEEEQVPIHVDKHILNSSLFKDVYNRF